jgi:hypothetical protein
MLSGYRMVAIFTMNYKIQHLVITTFILIITKTIVSLDLEPNNRNHVENSRPQTLWNVPKVTP